MTSIPTNGGTHDAIMLEGVEEEEGRERREAGSLRISEVPLVERLESTHKYIRSPDFLEVTTPAMITEG